MLVVVVLGATGASAPHRGSDNAGIDTLTLPKAIVLGVVEGVTEYLPISSTGHLLVAERLMSLGGDADKDATDTYTVVVQIGAILAVLGLYRRRFATMVDGVLGRSAEGRSALIALVVAFIPAAIIGKVFGNAIKDHLLQPWPVVAAEVVGGIVILVFVANQARLRVRTETLDALGWRQAAIIGCAQVLALWPGTSRSLVTILAAMLIGCSLQVAVEFSFLLGFLTLSAASAYELLQNGGTLVDTFGWVNPIVGVVVAGISAAAAVKWMVTYLQRHPLTIFGWYRIGFGAVVAGLLLTNVI